MGWVLFGMSCGGVAFENFWLFVVFPVPCDAVEAAPPGAGEGHGKCKDLIVFFLMLGSLSGAHFDFVTDRVWTSSLKRSFLNRVSRSRAKTGVMKAAGFVDTSDSIHRFFWDSMDSADSIEVMGYMFTVPMDFIGLHAIYGTMQSTVFMQSMESMCSLECQEPKNSWGPWNRWDPWIPVNP